MGIYEIQNINNHLMLAAQPALNEDNNNLALLSHSHQEMQDKTIELARISAQVGRKINSLKQTRILKFNATCQVMPEGEAL